ncbi:unnamed protein product [Mytilus edulis]|uniref:MULE transposase domain-containing protein n=1 Tax=Mytilus edulis TaxID=6550 RepID=A0A8S3RQG5_MYTED|nr:unnamed protein product [Mytilus edulis]
MTTDELDNGNRTDCQTKQVLQKAVYEARKEVLLHEDTFKEIVLTQELLFDEDTSSDKIRGYIQTISYDPFMVIMFTQAQFEILVSRLKSGKCYLYFDATGSVISKLGTPKKRVLYYALVIRSDIENDPPLPVAEMFTNDNATPAISHFLHTIRHNIVKHFGVRTVPTKIETDFSWPLIYASLLIFNREDLPVYLSRAWNITTRKYKEPVMAKFTIVHLCASHMIKK